MAKAFLKQVAEYIYEKHKDKTENLCIVLPNKRGALFLKHELAKSFGKTIWLPTIISAEDLISELSGLKSLEEIDLICHLYESYKTCFGGKAESFDSFAKWGQLILQDFNEIDRYLADSEQLYENLKDIKVIENWSLGEEKLSEYQLNYLEFMNSIGAIYKHYTNFLLSNNWAYQGLAYKYAVINQDKSEFASGFEKILFCGFNALNAAELKIFHNLFSQKKADILWDADTYYLENDQQEAGLFLRKNFDLFKEKEPAFIESNFKSAKEINIISVPKQIGQAQVVKQSLQKLIDEKVPLDKVAVVLANEKLLWPVLQQLPAEVEQLNITMEYPLRYTSTYGFIEQLLQIQINFEKQKRTHKTIYHHELINLFRQPVFSYYLKAKNIPVKITHLIHLISERNMAFLSQKNLQALLDENYEKLKFLLVPARSIQELCSGIQEIIVTCITYFSEQEGNNQNKLELEYLQILLKNFNRLNDVIVRYPHFNDIHSFRQLFTQVVGNSSAPFIGEPLSGLQIMGVLETRTLDFDHVILVNVNEGVLPSGKTINSFIPNDLKRAFGLPLYLEKDAIYAYHFYRLIQKAETVSITYDSETDTFGKGEKSRFLTQLQLEMPSYNPNIQITEQVASYTEFPDELENKISIHKDQTIVNELFKKAGSNDQYGGLSPSGLIAYKDCALKFYFRYGAHLKETKEVEESAEANTFGSILHLSLETLYQDLKGKIIAGEILTKKTDDVETVVNQSFMSFFNDTAPVGKSILQQEVIKVYVKKLLNNDLKFIEALQKNNHHLSLLHLEKELSAGLEVSINGENKTVYIKGKIDRVDSYQGFVRVIDYKSSVKSSDKFNFTDFETLFMDADHNKQFQLLLYAWLLFKNKISTAEKIQVCIIPFKVFLDEPKYLRDTNKQIFKFTEEFFNAFETELRLYISSIFDEKKPFEQTEDTSICEYCAYNVICNL